MFISLCPCSLFGVFSTQPLPYVTFHTKLSTVRWFELDKTKISQSQWKAGGFVSCRLTLLVAEELVIKLASGAQHTLNVLVLTLTLMFYTASNDILKWNIWLILNSKQQTTRRTFMDPVCNITFVPLGKINCNSKKFHMIFFKWSYSIYVATVKKCDVAWTLGLFCWCAQSTGHNVTQRHRFFFGRTQQ